MKRLSIWIILVAVACAAALAQGPQGPDGPNFVYMRVAGPQGGFGVAHFGFGLMGPPVKGAPYSAQGTTEFTQTLADGTHINRTESYTIYRDGEGRIRRESDDQVWISDPVARVSYVLDTKQQTARKLPLNHDVAYQKMEKRVAEATAVAPVAPPPGAHKMVVSPKAAKTETLGKQVMEGVQVDGTRNTFAIPVGEVGNDRALQIVDERWESADLHVTVLAKHTDPMMGDHMERLTSIQRGEPDPALFVVPSGYQVK